MPENDGLMSESPARSRSTRRRPCSRRATTSPTAASPPRSTCRSPCSGRCSSKARPGVGKTEIAKVVAQALGRDLIRLQCYEGLDIAQAAYEWNYSRQMIEIRLAEAAGEKSREGRSSRTSSPSASSSSGRCCAALEGAQRAAGAADRRAGPHRRAVRGLPAGSAVRLADHHSRDRHAAGRRAADRGDHLQPHARDPRRGEAPLLLPLGGLSRREARARDPAAQGAEGRRRRCRARWWRSCSSCARSTSSSCRASPRPSTGRTAWRRSTAWCSTPRR